MLKRGNHSVSILAIEATCDESGIAWVVNRRVRCNFLSSQSKNFEKYGGVVPMLAARGHSQNLPLILNKVLNKFPKIEKKIDYIAYSSEPGLAPCLHISKVFAQTLSLVMRKPIVACNHLFAHLYATKIDSVSEWHLPALGLVISGGHTKLFIIKEDYSFEEIGTTVDDAIGECFDKVGRMVGVKYPAGSEIEKIAKLGKPNYTFFRFKRRKGNFNFSFSGLKSACARFTMANLEFSLPDFFSSFQQAVILILVSRVEEAFSHFPYFKSLVVGGGVSSNLAIRLALEESCLKYKVKLFCPRVGYSTDNAAMVGVYAYEKIKRENEFLGELKES